MLFKQYLKRRFLSFFPVVFIFLFLSGSVYGEKDHKNSSYWNDTARFLGGLPPAPDSQIKKYEKAHYAKTHKNFFNKSWDKVENNNLKPQKIWAESQISQERSSSRTVFYPFSGPDFLNIFTFFPDGNEYILFGMEPPGLPPDLSMISENNLPAALANLRKSLATILNFSFFRTLDMAKDLKKMDLRGAAPIIIVFMTRTGNEIKNIESVALEKKGTIRLIKDPYKIKNGIPTQKTLSVLSSEIPGIRITFRKPGSSRDQTLYFFSLDISNTGLRSKGQLLTFVKKKGPLTTYLKAASYLMYRETFSTIRNFILNESLTVMQDDSGMPLKSFQTSKWNLSFYGNYTKPIRLFQSRYQPDLRAVYTDKNRNIGELPFGIGYNWKKGQSNLMIARKK
ncbi:MAG: hypothetical protein OEZ34_00115 [Spirochaetia bacterium]|nr:hypothetical protein [Spirochaetia bacterium]